MTATTVGKIPKAIPSGPMLGGMGFLVVAILAGLSGSSDAFQRQMPAFHSHRVTFPTTTTMFSDLFEQDPLSSAERGNGAKSIPQYKPLRRPVKRFNSFEGSEPQFQQQQDELPVPEATASAPSNSVVRPVRSQQPMTPSMAQAMSQQPKQQRTVAYQPKSYQPKMFGPVIIKKETETISEAEMPAPSVPQVSVQEETREVSQEEPTALPSVSSPQAEAVAELQQPLADVQEQAAPTMPQPTEQQELSPPQASQPQPSQVQQPPPPPPQPAKKSYFQIASEFDRIDASSWQNDPDFRRRLNDFATYFELFDDPQAEWSSSEFIRKEHHRRKKERRKLGHFQRMGQAMEVSDSESLTISPKGQGPKRFVRYNPNNNN